MVKAEDTMLADRMTDKLAVAKKSRNLPTLLPTENARD